jgi:hypothetical protein
MHWAKVADWLYLTNGDFLSITVRLDFQIRQGASNDCFMRVKDFMLSSLCLYFFTHVAHLSSARFMHMQLKAALHKIHLSTKHINFHERGRLGFKSSIATQPTDHAYCDPIDNETDLAFDHMVHLVHGLGIICYSVIDRAWRGLGR